MRKPASKQQYVLKRKSTVKNVVSAKLKKQTQTKQAQAAAKKIQPVKAATRPKQKTMVLKMPQTAAAAEVIEEKLPPGFKAKLEYKNIGISVSADVRYETEKTDSLVKIKHIGPQGEIVHKELIGPLKLRSGLMRKVTKSLKPMFAQLRRCRMALCSRFRSKDQGD